MRRVLAQVVCDRCGRPAEGTVDLETLWAALEEQGWEARDIEGVTYELCGPRKDGDELLDGCVTKRFDP